MAITLNNEQSSTTKTLSYTPSSVSNSVLVVVTGSEDLTSNDPITNIDFGGVGLTLAVAAAGGPDAFSATQRIEIWYLVNPGTSNATITVTGGEALRTGLKAITLGGCNQASPVDVTGINSWASSTSPPQAVGATTTEANTLAISAWQNPQAASSTVVGATKLADVQITGSWMGVAWSAEATAGLYSHSWNYISAQPRGALATAAFKEAGGGGGEDNLLADSLESAATLSTPALSSGGGEDNLLANSLQSLTTLSAPAVGQSHALQASSLQALSTLSTPALSEIHNLSPDSIQALSTLTQPALGQVHSLSAISLQSLVQLSTPLINRPESETLIFGALGFMSADGSGTAGLISAEGAGGRGDVDDSPVGARGMISNQVCGVRGNITEIGIGTRGDIKCP